MHSLDTQEAAKSLTLEDSSSLESLDSVPSDTRTASPPPAATPTLSYPTWRPVIGNQILGRSSTGAFSTYARTRGEPDGRTATFGNDQKGRESDTFTPSPVDTMKPYTNSIAQKASPQASPHLAINLSHQSKIRCMYNDSPASDNNGTRPDSSSSTSSATDWDSGQSTVRRQITARDMDSFPGKDCISLRSYPGFKKNICNSLSASHAKHSSVSSLNEDIEANQSNNNSEFDFSSSNSDIGNFSAPLSNFNLSSTSVKSDMKKKSMFASVVNKTLNKDFSRKGFSKVDSNHHYYRRSNTLSHVVETKAQIHQTDIGSKTYPGAESGIYAPCLEGKTQENVDILEIRVPPAVGCRNKSTYVPQAFHNSLLGKKDHSNKNILNTQLRHLSQELPISDVYHDRSVGLGLAPSLSKILTSDNINVLNDDQHSSENTIQSRNININSNQKHTSSRQKPPLPPKHHPNMYNHSHKDHRSSSEAIHKDDILKNCSAIDSSLNAVNFSIRDQGDGGSFTDLSCPNQNQDLFPPSLKVFSMFINSIEDSQLPKVHGKENSKKSKSDIIPSDPSAFKNNISSVESSPKVEETVHPIDCTKSFYNSGFEPQDTPIVLPNESHNFQKDGWSLDSNRNHFTSSTTSDTEGSDVDNSSKNISTVKRNPKHILSPRCKVPDNPSSKPSTC